MLVVIIMSRDLVMECGANVYSSSLSSKGKQPFDTHKSQNGTGIELQ